MIGGRIYCGIMVCLSCQSRPLVVGFRLVFSVKRTESPGLIAGVFFVYVASSSAASIVCKRGAIGYHPTCKPQQDPAVEACLIVFFAILSKALAACMSAVREYATFTLNRYFFIRKCKIKTPAPGRVEAVFIFRIQSGGPHVQRQGGFQSGRGGCI